MGVSDAGCICLDTGIRRGPLFFPNPRTGRIWAHKAMANAWARAVDAAELPHTSLYEGTKHTFATDAIRRGVPERLTQRFLGHASVHSTRRYARLANNARLEVLRLPERGGRQTGDKVSRDKPERSRGIGGEPSRVRMRVAETEEVKKAEKLGPYELPGRRQIRAFRAQVPPESHHLWLVRRPAECLQAACAARLGAGRAGTPSASIDETPLLELAGPCRIDAKLRPLVSVKEIEPWESTTST
jgi:hypothetical protein